MGLLVWLLAVPAVAETLVVATYNAQNYGLANRMTADGYRREYPKPESEKAALRRVIRAVAADLVVLQEIGGVAQVEELRRDLRSEGCDYPHQAVAAAADPDRQIAILARRRLEQVRVHRDLAFNYLGRREIVKRGLFEVTVATSAGPIVLFGVHLKSRFTDEPADPLSSRRRAAEATAIRDRILGRAGDPSRSRFVILGDCNDSRTSRPLAALQRRGATTIAELLTAADSRGETWTHAFRREDLYSRVDYVLVSPALLPWVRGGKGEIHDGPDVAAASDHRPVVLTLQIPAAPEA